MMQEVQFSFSGLRYTYNDSRLPLDKVTGVETQNADGDWTPLDEDRPVSYTHLDVYKRQRKASLWA